MSRFRTRSMYSTLISLYFAIFLCSCTLMNSFKTNSEGGSNRRRNSGPAPVTVMQVENKVSARELKAVVPLVGRNQTEVYPKVAGRISQINVTEGQPIKRGQLIFSIDRMDPGESFLSVPVTSPISGWIGRLNATTGQLVGLSDAVALVVDDTSLRATVYLPLEVWSLIKKDTKVTVGVSDQIYDAQVRTIARAAEPNTGRGSFDIEVQNDNNLLRSGMLATVIVSLEPRERIRIPAAALRLSDQGAFLFIVQKVAQGSGQTPEQSSGQKPPEGAGEGQSETFKAQRIQIEFEAVDNDTVEITKGLSGGETLVLQGNNLLSDGSEIKIAGKPQAAQEKDEAKK